MTPSHGPLRPTRRQILRGAGGASLLLPLLPSLLRRRAEAAALAGQKRFIYIGTEHGGASVENMYGTQGATATAVDVWPGNTAHYAPLALSSAGGTSSLSPILTAASSTLTPSLARKLTLIRGIDHANAVGHQDGAHLGNNAAQVGDRAGTLTPMVTIDQLMAYSPSFYGAQVPRMRSIYAGTPNGRCLSWTYANPSTRTGVQKQTHYSSSLQLFNMLFAREASPQPMAARPLIIDRVIDTYRALRSSNRRLSVADRRRLDDHVARLTELERKLVALSKPLDCGVPQPPADTQAIARVIGSGVPLSEHHQFYKLIGDVIITAFACGASRIAVLHAEAQMSTYQGDWHQNIAHQDESPAPQMILAAAYQEVFEHVFMYLATGLDAIKEADGSTALDSTLLVWSQECGYHTHDPYQFPIVMAGSAGGYFKTGLYVDYRNQVPSCQNIDSSHRPMPGNFSGLVYEQFLATALYAMGIRAGEWTQPNGLPGYGDYKATDPMFTWAGKSTRGPNVIANASMPLPIISNA